MSAGSQALPAPSARRGWVAAAVAVALAFVAFGLVADAFAPGPQGPPESSFATSPSGLAAWAELLGRAEHRVTQLRRSLDGARVLPTSALVVLGESAVTPSAARSLRDFLQAGGRLILGGGRLDRVMRALVSSPPGWRPAGPRSFTAESAELPGVSKVTSAGEGSFGSGTVSLLAGPGRAGLLMERAVGRGRLELLADPSPLENRLLGRADNAQLALDLAGEARRPVVFAEAIHGYGRATGLGAIPGRWWIAFAGLALAGGAWALARGKRLGPPEAPPPPAVPPRSAYVDALAATLLRARDPDRTARLASEAAARVRSRRRG